MAAVDEESYVNKLPSTAAPNDRAGANPKLSQLRHLQELTQRPGKAGVPVEKQIKVLRAAMPPDLLRFFDHRAEHGQVAVAMASASGACGSCHLRLPSGLASSLNGMAEEMDRCPFCGCYLYSPLACSSDSARTSSKCLGERGPKPVTGQSKGPECTRPL